MFSEVPLILGQDVASMALAQDECVVENLASDAADDSKGGVQVREVACDHALGLSGEELLPRGAIAPRGRVEPCRGKDLPDNGCCDRVAKSGQFTLDGAMAPVGIFLSQAHHQLLGRVVGRWPSAYARVVNRANVA